MEHQPVADDHAEERVRPLSARAVADVQSRAASAKAAWSAAEQLRKLVEQVARAWPARPALVVLAIDKDARTLDGLSDDDPVRVELTELARESRARAEAAARSVVRDLPEQLVVQGLVLDLSSRHPGYSVDDHLVEVEVDATKLLALITPRHGDVVREPLDVEAVARRVGAERARLLGRDFDAPAFLAALDAALPESQRESAVPVRDVARALAGKRKPRLDEFAVDLGRLLHSSVLEAHPRRLVVNHTRNTREGLLLHGLERGGYVGTVEMRGRTS